jgi:membrane protease YdiL (CAAX protease family)
MRSKIFFVAYLIAFNGIWTLWVLVGYPRLARIGDQTLLYALINLAIRGLLWVLPVFLYLRYLDRVEPCAYLKLKKHWLRGVLVGLAFAALIFLLLLAEHGPPRFRTGTITWNSMLSTSLLIGFVEEVPYRGFVFQKMCDWLSVKSAIAISSLLFVAIHLPGWLSLHLFTMRTFVFVFVFGVAMAILLLATRSLWASIVSHSLNDFLTAVVFPPG